MHIASFTKHLKQYFPVPSYLDIPSVGIDISPLAVRFIEIISKKDQFKVGNFGHERLKNIFNIETEEGKVESREILAKWKSQYNLKFAEVTLPEEKAYLFRTNVPLGNDNELRSSIEFNLKKMFP